MGGGAGRQHRPGASEINKKLQEAAFMLPQDLAAARSTVTTPRSPSIDPSLTMSDFTGPSPLLFLQQVSKLYLAFRRLEYPSEVQNEFERIVIDNPFHVLNQLSEAATAGGVSWRASFRVMTAIFHRVQSGESPANARGLEQLTEEQVKNWHDRVEEYRLQAWGKWQEIHRAQACDGSIELLHPGAMQVRNEDLGSGAPVLRYEDVLQLLCTEIYTYQSLRKNLVSEL